MSGRYQDYVVGGLLVVLVCVAGLTAGRVASSTAYNRHPDEAYHIDAFCYFQSHWRPPDLNADGLLYSPSGWSRVYNAELVYAAYGNLSRLAGLVALPQALARVRGMNLPQAQGIRAASPAEPSNAIEDRADQPCQLRDYRQFRVMNVALYVLTLVVVFVVGRRRFWLIAMGVAMIAIPQISYIYAYANSDAWGLSLSIFLLLYALHLSRNDKFTVLGAAGLGLLTGMVLVTKKPFWSTIPFAYLFLMPNLYACFSQADRARRREVVVGLLVTLGVAVVAAGPLLALYPWTQGDFAASEITMREMRAMESWKPSNPTAYGYMLSARGEPFRTVWANPLWWDLTAKSSYALFGYMTIFVPGWMYWLALAVMCIGLAFTLDTLMEQWRKVPSWGKITLAAAPILIGLNILASLFHSWTIDFQPQGRYLLPSLLPLAYLWAGLYDGEPKWMQRSRWVLLAALVVAGAYAMWTVALRAPTLLT